jgi:integrase
LIRVDLCSEGRSEDGQRKRYQETFRGTREQAEDRLADLVRDQRGGRWTEPSCQPLAAYLKEWLETAAQPRVSGRTLENYREILERYAIPELGKLPLNRIGPMAIQKLYRKHQDKPSSVRTLHVVLHQAFTQAVRWRILAYPPTADVEIPRQRRKSRAVALSRNQLEAFVSAARADRWAVFWLCSVFTGARPEELLGLRRQNVIREQCSIRIEEVLVRVRKTNPEEPTWRLEPPKTARSRRTIPLPLPVMRALEQHLEEQDAHRVQLGTAYQDHGFVFAGQLGQPLHHQNLLNRHFKALLEKAGLPRVRMYDLRHSHASLLLAEGEQVKVVSDRLGHSSTAFTMDTYVHLVEDQQRQAADRLGAMFFAEEPGLRRVK